MSKSNQSHHKKVDGSKRMYKQLASIYFVPYFSHNAIKGYVTNYPLQRDN